MDDRARREDGLQSDKANSAAAPRRKLPKPQFTIMEGDIELMTLTSKKRALEAAVARASKTDNDVRVLRTVELWSTETA